MSLLQMFRLGKLNPNAGGNFVQEKKAAALAQSQSAPANRSTVAVANAPVTTTVIAPAGIGSGQMVIGSGATLPASINLVVNSDAATASTDVLLWGKANVYGRGWTTNAPVVVTSPGVNGVDAYSYWQDQLCYMTIQFVDVTLISTATATSSSTYASNPLAQLQKNWLRATNTGDSYKSNFIYMKNAKNPYQYDQLMNIYAFQGNEGVKDPSMAIGIPEMLPKVNLDLTFSILNVRPGGFATN